MGWFNLFWKELFQINTYAVLMGYLSKAVRGTGLLVLTWTTVVLLGGFVSSLEKTDFWCLTSITFMQAAGVFDASGNHKRFRYIGGSLFGITSSVIAFWGKALESSSRWGRVRDIVWVLAMAAAVPIQALVLAIVVCPLFVLYVSGPYVPVWLGVWRLSHRDYSKGNGQANLTVALDILYTLVVAQGALVYYMGIHTLAGRLIAADVVKVCKFDGLASSSVSDYMDDAIKGCSKDPSFVEGMDMMTYAVEQIKSGSAHRNLVSGVRILDTLIENLKPSRWDDGWLQHRCYWDDWLAAHHMGLKQLIVNSEEIVVLKLLRLLDRRSPCDKELRKRAARIVAYIAGGIHLKQYPPQAIQWIASLLDTFQEYHVLEPYQRDWLLHAAEEDWTQEVFLAYISGDDDPEVGYGDLMLQALHILWRLAANEDNCEIMRNHVGLLSKAMAPVTNDLLHKHGVGDHDEWSGSVVEGSLRLMCQLVAAPGETGKKLRSDIVSGNSNEAIGTMERILQCNHCGPRLKEKAIQTLTELYMEPPSSGLANFMKKLVQETFFKEEPGSSREETESDESSSTTKLGQDKSVLQIYEAETGVPDITETAARALMRISLQMENSATIILMQNADIIIINDLTTLLVRAEEKTYPRIAAAVVLERLCIYYNDLKNLEKNTSIAEALFLQCQANLKTLMSDEMPKVLEEIRAYYLNADKGYNLEHISMFMKRFIPAYMSLFMTVCEKCVSTDQDSARLFGAIDTSIPMLLKDMVDKNGHRRGGSGMDRKRDSQPRRSSPADCQPGYRPSPQYCLRIVKLITRIVIAMMNHGGSCAKEDELHCLMESLSTALSDMSTLDASMVFVSNEDGAWRVRDSMLNSGEGQHSRSLRSLVEEAKRLVNEKKTSNNLEIVVR